METSPLICSANQWTGFYMITASVMKGLNKLHETRLNTLLLFNTLTQLYIIFMKQYPLPSLRLWRKLF